MDYDCIIYEKKDKIGLIKLNRPKVLNAMNRQLWIEMQDALETVKQDNDIKALIITGEGRAFSTGADLKEKITGYTLSPCRKHQGRSYGLKNQPLQPLTVTRWVPVMSLPWPVISGLRLKKRLSDPLRQE